MSTWTINDASPESYGLRIVGGTFRSGRASAVQLSRAVAFDASEIPFSHGASVTIKRDGAPFFRGKVRACDKSGSGSDEGQDFLVEDVWTDLELLTYQEPWLIQQSDYAGLAYSPTVVLGMNSSGTRINVGEQIGEVLAFAISQLPVDTLQAGTMPTGMMLWPSEVTGMSCAQVIRDCLKYYPDWVPWVDQSTSPPTFKVTPRAAATTISLAVTDTTNFQITKTQDRVPTGVRIVYLTASVITVDGEANPYRNMSIDQFPAVSVEALVAPAAAGVLATEVKLAGTNQVITKQKVRTRHIPTSLTDGVLNAKEYLKRKFPQLADIDDANFTLSDWTRTAIVSAEDEPDDIDTKLPRLLATTLAKMPRELTSGNVPESAQRYVGQVRLQFEITAESGASEAERKVIERIPTDFVVKGTNATTKKYPVLTSYTPGESAPTGIAQAFYTTLANGCYFEGSATLHSEELSSAAWHGAVLNLTGGASEWATMKAPIHSVSWDLESCETVLDFGPNPDYSLQDFMEFLHLLNKRVNTEYTVAERTGDKFGDEDGISAKGELAGGYDGPETILLGGGGSSAPPPTGAFFGITTVEGVKYLQGGTVSAGSGSDTAANIALTDALGAPLHAAGQHMYVNALGNGVTSDGVLLPGFNLTSASVGYGATVPSNTLPLAAGATGKRCYVDLGVFTATGFLPNAAGNIQISYCPGAFNVSRY